MTNLPDWDFLPRQPRVRREGRCASVPLHRAWERRCQVYVVDGRPAKVGDTIRFHYGFSYGAWRRAFRSHAKGYSVGVIERVISRDDFEAFNLGTASEEDVTVVANLMAGVPLRPQWVDELLLQIRAIAQAR